MKIESLTDEQKRIAIAEACGWIKVRQHWEKQENGETVSAYCNDSHAHRQLPDYLNDLNAIHEAEKAAIIGEHEDSYYFYLHGMGCEKIAFATAAQRADAFLSCLP